MWLPAGQVSRAVKGREAWQEMDFPAVFGSLTKWAVEPERAPDLPAFVAKAFDTSKPVCEKEPFVVYDLE